MPAAQRYHQYQVLRREDGSLWELGRGAMGITYKAFDTNLRFPVALKVINAAYLENDTARQRFLREARAAAALRHPNVASVFNLGTEEDEYYYVMEFIDGETVEARVKRQGPLEPVEALNIGLQVARALAVAAKQQLVHRDLKPTNLMLVDQEGEQIVKVIDFGLAKVQKDSGEDSGALTVAGFVGTPHFASPEQIEEGDIDIRSDIYSLGVTLYYGLTGQSPFSGSIGQVMSQQLYKPLPITLLAHLPQCVVSLLQHMMEKDPNNRPQTPQDLQRDILACLEEIRRSPFQDAHPAEEATSAFETLDLTSTSSQPPGVGAVLAQNYKLIEELTETPQGRNFLADDLRRRRQVNVLLLSTVFLSDRKRFTALEEAVHLVRTSPHPALREIYSLETVTDCTFLVQEHVTGPLMLDVLRTRSELTAPEVARLVSLLAPLADHAGRHRLQHIDMTLLGIHLTDRPSTRTGIQPDLLRRPLTAWEPLEAKVDAINFSFSTSPSDTWISPATRTPDVAVDGPRGSYVRLLSLLAYELLGGPRARLDQTGQYTPVARLNREGNAVLRRGIVDEWSSADELARELAAAVVFKGPASPASETSKPISPEPLSKGLPEIVHRAPPESVADAPSRRKPARIGWLFLLAIGLIALTGIVGYLAFWHPQVQEIYAPQEIPTLSVIAEPSGSSILLDGKPPQVPPNTFTHVSFGSHQITAASDGYESIKQNIEVRKGMAPQLHLQLKPIVELAALSVATDPAGASILLDGKPPQSPPSTFTHVPFGPHQVIATLEDYEPLKQNIEVRKGTAPQLHLQLKPVVELAALSVATEPTGASILLDGKPPQSPPSTFTHVPFGPHQVTATLEDYEPLKQNIEVRKGMAPQLRLELKPIEELAALSIATEPAGASILLDGKPPQSPPNTFTHVPFGPHQVTATLEDYEPVKRNIEVRKGMTPEVRLQLKADSIAVLKNQIKRNTEGSPQQLTAYVRLVQLLAASATPDAGEYTNELVRILEQLRTKVPPIGKNEFTILYEESVKEAASLEIVPAMLWLAENETPSEAYRLFLRAAQLGDSYAMMKLGRLYLRKGTQADDEEGFRWLERAYAAPKPNLEAGAFIADCYLSGKGATQNVQKAEEIVTPLANQGVTPAMTLAGRILQYRAQNKQSEAAGNSSPQLRKKLEAEANDLDRQARRWWERAEKDDWNASAHLGKCYEEGWGGVERNEAEAEKRYKAGASHGNALSMFFYALILEKRPGHRSETESLMVRAAAMGLPSAAKWCKENNVPIQETKADEEHR